MATNFGFFYLELYLTLIERVNFKNNLKNTIGNGKSICNLNKLCNNERM